MLIILSGHPLRYKKDASVEEEIFRVTSQQLNKHPVSASETGCLLLLLEQLQGTQPPLGHYLTQHGWPNNFCNNPGLKSYFHCRHKLSIKHDCLPYINPSWMNCTEHILELHTKATAHSHVWWPRIDSIFEETAWRHQHCIKTRKVPPVKPLSPGSWLTAPWQHIHIDFGTHQSKLYLTI